MSSAPGSIFTGGSQFSSQFQAIIAQAVQTAELPIQQVQNDITTLQSQFSELTTLGGDFSTLQAAVTTLGNALGTSSYSASASGSNVASVALSGTPGVGTYTVEVDSIGSYASALSASAVQVADPSQGNITDATAYTLTVGANSITIQPSGSTLSDLVTAINNSSAGVQATVVNLGTSASPDYQLSIRNNQLGAVAMHLTAIDGSEPGQDLLAQQATGAPTTYRVDGNPAAPANPLSSNSNSITLSPGVTATLLNTGTSTITVSQNATAVSTALAGFVSAYNAVQTEIATNRGQGTGALQGQSVLMTLSDTLNQIANYASGNSGISSLASLGVTYSSANDGSLKFDSSVFTAATSGELSQLAAFLGSASGGGFLELANNSLNAITDPTSGVIQSGTGTLSAEVVADRRRISDQQSRVSAMQTNLANQMAAADASISALEQQYSYLYSMFQAMQIDQQNGG
jgi:flagellar hook-associated protein 2